MDLNSFDRYEPPFDMTEEMVNLTVETCMLAKQFVISSNLSRNPHLRKNNRVKTIYSSLAIEHNSLTEDQVVAIIDGKQVIAPQRDIQEIRNATEAYEMLDRINPYSLSDLLAIHKVMMKDVLPDAGVFRAKGVGVYRGTELIHMGTRPELIGHYVKELIEWTRNSKLHPLIKSCIFHYEFEYIHPFSDGNGRTGRFWHTLILSHWEPMFAWLPVENLIHRKQEEYYKAIIDSDNEGKSTPFIIFMLRVIKEVLEENVGINVGTNVGIKVIVLESLRANPYSSAQAVALRTGYSQRQVERAVAALKKDGVLVRNGSNKTGFWTICE